MSSASFSMRRTTCSLDSAPTRRPAIDIAAATIGFHAKRKASRPYVLTTDFELIFRGQPKAVLSAIDTSTAAESAAGDGEGVAGGAVGGGGKVADGLASWLSTAWTPASRTTS